MAEICSRLSKTRMQVNWMVGFPNKLMFLRTMKRHYSNLYADIFNYWYIEFMLVLIAAEPS